MHHFSELQLPLEIEKALKAMRMEIPTPIQSRTIPIAMEGKDLIGCAQTGTGKTLAFCLPLLSNLMLKTQSSALILVPTRELAVQISDVIESLLKFKRDIRQALLIGGMSMQTQNWSLQQGARIFVATPGRLLDHLKSNNLTLTRTQTLILDEADRMLDMGFSHQLDQILRYLPESRQTLLFSATLPDNIEKLAKRFLKDPQRVTIGRISSPNQQIKQTIVRTTLLMKNKTLSDEIYSRKGSVLIFARTKSRTDRLAQYLEKSGHPVAKLHGGRSQGQRNSAISAFRSGRYRILVATDIASRGIDISHIAHVINYDLPAAPEDYIHRIGRTGRAGAEGQAVSILTPEDQKKWNQISLLLERNIIQKKAPL